MRNGAPAPPLTAFDIDFGWKIVIGHFPSPYPDELLYSVIARMRERFPDLAYRNLGVDLFASSTATAISDLPHRLSVLVEMLPP